MNPNFLANFLTTASIVAVTDRLGTITYVNDKFCEISKYSREELIGQNHRLLKSGIHKPEFYENMWRMVATGKTWHGELCNKAKDGTYYWVDSFIMPHRNEKGIIDSYYSFRILITDKKEAFATLLNQRDKLEYIAWRQSHEVRSPVARILGLVDLLHREIPELHQNKIMDLLISTTNELDMIIREIVNEATELESV